MSSTCEHGGLSMTCPTCAEIADHEETIQELEREERMRRKVQRAAREWHLLCVVTWDNRRLWRARIGNGKHEACHNCYRALPVNGRCTRRDCLDAVAALEAEAERDVVADMLGGDRG